MSVVNVFLAGLANGLDAAPDDQPPKAEEFETVFLKDEKELPVVAFDEDATG